ncbi:aminotransferase class IV [Moraxella marmotae]|uniref:aminotransferase class IV n=1 Tax=Moraxella marmotae TaxID=3344520 RepID=UPI0035F2BA7F
MTLNQNHMDSGNQFYQWQQSALFACDARMDERAFAFGDGFFSTIGVYDGQMICANLHQKRILAGLAAFKLGLDDERLMFDLAELAGQINQGIIKIIITRAVQAVRGYGFVADHQHGNTAQIFIKVMPLPIYQQVAFFRGIPVQPVQPRSMVLLDSQIAHRPARLSGIKLIGCAEQVLAHSELLAHQQADGGIADGLVANVHGDWVCATMGNIFYQLDNRGLDNGQWYTPPVDKSGVLGVMRTAIIHQNLLGAVSERVLTTADLVSVRRLVSTNAVRGITPISQLCVGDDRLPLDTQILLS